MKIQDMNREPRGLTPRGAGGMAGVGFHDLMGGSGGRTPGLRGGGLGYTFTDDAGNTWEVNSEGDIELLATGQTPTQSAGASDAPTVSTAAQTNTGDPSGAQAQIIAQTKNPTAAQTDWLSQLAAAVPKALQLYNAQQIASVNVRRAQAGLPALNPAMYGPQVGVGLNPATTDLLLYGALGIGAIMLLSGRKGKK